MATKPVEHDEVACAAPDCDVTFVPKRSTAKYHTGTCQRRASRARKATAAEAESEKDAGSDAEHGLVKAVRRDLEKAKAIDTVPGQLALQFARRMANPEESGLSAMSKELRSLLAEAKAESADAGDKDPKPSAEEDDEVKKARRARDRKRAALGEEDAG